MSRVGGPEHVRWEPQRFYWCVVDAPGWRRSGVVPEGLRAELENDVPLDPDRLHAVCTPVADGRIVVCAVAREALAAVPAGTASLTPSALPGCIDGSVDPATLNLLVGDFEPAHARRARARRHTLAAVIVLLCSVLVVTGLFRRAGHWRSVAQRAREARAALVAAGVPDHPGDPRALLAELARLRAGADAAAKVQPTADAALALAALLRAWPADLPCKPQSLTVSPAGAVISVALDGDPAPFIAAFKPPPGWSASEPRLNASGGITRASVQFNAPAEGGRAAP